MSGAPEAPSDPAPAPAEAPPSSTEAPPPAAEEADPLDAFPTWPVLALAFALSSLVAYLVFRLFRPDDDDWGGGRMPAPRPDAPQHEPEIQRRLRQRQPAG